MPKKHIRADLVGHAQIEIRRLRREVADQFWLGCDIVGQSRNWPWPEVLASAPLLRDRFAGLDGRRRALRHAAPHGAKFRITDLLRYFLVVPEDRGDVFGELINLLAVDCKVRP